MVSSNTLTETLHTVTGIKIPELRKQKQAYERAKQSLLEKAQNEADSRKRVQLLLDGSEELPGIKDLRSHPLFNIHHLWFFVEQARFDPSVSDRVLADYEKTVRNQLDAETANYDFTELYGELVKEWTSSNNTNTTDSESVFVSLGHEDMHQQRATLKEYVFHAKETDTTAIKAYLDEIFANNPSKEVIKEFQTNWDRSSHFETEGVTACIENILDSSVISDSKRSALRGFLENKIVISEIKDAMNMRMAARSSFALDGPTLNGRCRFYPDEDLLQMIFLQYIGAKWAIELKRALTEFTFADGVLKSPSGKLGKQALRRRQFFLGNGSALQGGSVEDNNDETWRADVFLDQLPNGVEYNWMDDEDKPEYGYEEAYLPQNTRNSRVLLHRIQAHLSSIFTVLRYFGVQEEWIHLFKKVLEAPITFKDDAPDSAPRVRKRGTPIGTRLATFFGEFVLSCVDFAVNQKTNGAKLWRMQDDFWLWGDTEVCSKGWDTLTEFSHVMGLDFDEEKTGSCQILAPGSDEQANANANLPSGDLVWGLIKLDAASGEFVVNQAKVDVYIEALDLQLKACNSIFDFVLTWNIYGCRFFLQNCREIDVSTTRQQLHELLETLRRIQSRVFRSSNGSVEQHLKRMIQDRSGGSDIPDGFLYYPPVLGGLGLENPFIYLNLFTHSTAKSSEKFLEKLFKDEEKEYRSRKQIFEELGTGNESSGQTIDSDVSGDNPEKSQSRRAAGGFPEPTGEWADLRDEPFMSFEEFVQHREVTSLSLGMEYAWLFLEHGEPEIKMSLPWALSTVRKQKLVQVGITTRNGSYSCMRKRWRHALEDTSRLKRGYCQLA
uniref:Reverse transcriptase domain-containing protein n=1 Tax=Bionectria ochroleuca TaxID=29856 RepID=A0A0B7K7Y3_BIOOC